MKRGEEIVCEKCGATTRIYVNDFSDELHKHEALQKKDFALQHEMTIYSCWKCGFISNVETRRKRFS
jgi:DNA-directed RNA polymerase subunit RPC12/RpoP